MKNAVVITDNEVVTEVSQNHAVGKSNSDVEVLYVVDQTLQFLPKNIKEFFPNLKGITIFESKLQMFRKEDIEPFQQLLFFFIGGGNEIKTIDGDLFDSNPTVQYVSFTGNPITNIAPKVFDSLINLKEIHCFQCKCHSIDKDARKIDEIKLAFSQKCPPTFDMIEKALMKGEKISEKIEEYTNSLKMENEALINRVTELEKLLREGNTCSCG